MVAMVSMFRQSIFILNSLAIRFLQRNNRLDCLFQLPQHRLHLWRYNRGFSFVHSRYVATSSHLSRIASRDYGRHTEGIGSESDMGNSSSHMSALTANDLSGYIGIRSTSGMRGYNEDRYLVARLMNDVVFLGVFDGHGGSRCADFVTAHLFENLQQEMSLIKKDVTTSDTVASTLMDEDDARVAWEGAEASLCRAILRTDDQWKSLASEHNHDREMGYGSGTTVVVALFNVARSEVITANVGDSRCLLCVPNEQPVPLSTEHKVDTEVEMERILHCGGEVVPTNSASYRVCIPSGASLAMSRAIGSLQFRQYGVIPDPMSMHRKLNDKDVALILGSDGLFDVVSDSRIIDTITTCDDPEGGAVELVMESNRSHSQDNITVLLVRLRGWGGLTRAAEERLAMEHELDLLAAASSGDGRAPGGHTGTTDTLMTPFFSPLFVSSTKKAPVTPPSTTLSNPVDSTGVAAAAAAVPATKVTSSPSPTKVSMLSPPRPPTRAIKSPPPPNPSKSVPTTVVGEHASNHYSLHSPFGTKVDFSKFVALCDMYLPWDLGEDDIDEELTKFRKNGTGVISEAAFRVFDGDNDGKLGFPDVLSAMKRIKATGTEVNEVKLRQHFDKLDSKQVGVIDYDQFLFALVEN